jgi:hypothetical protein
MDWLEIYDGLFGKALSRGGSISSVRSQSSQQQREYREYHSSNQTHGGGTVLVGMPSSTSVDDGRSDDDFQGATTSVSDVNEILQLIFKIFLFQLTLFFPCRELKLGVAEVWLTTLRRNPQALDRSVVPESMARWKRS